MSKGQNVPKSVGHYSYDTSWNAKNKYAPKGIGGGREGTEVHNTSKPAGEKRSASKTSKVPKGVVRGDGTENPKANQKSISRKRSPAKRGKAKSHIPADAKGNDGTKAPRKVK